MSAFDAEISIQILKRFPYLTFNLCLLIKSTFFINNPGFTERFFSDKVYAILIEEPVRYKLRCVTASVS